MSALNSIKKFEKHHAALLIFLLIAGTFVINIAAFNAAYSRVREARVSGVAPLVVGPDESFVTATPDPSQSQPNEDQESVSFLKDIKPQLQSIIDQEGVDMAIYIQDLSTGEILGINESTTYVSASLYKLFASYEVARQVDLGLIEPSSATGFDAGNTSVEECLTRTLSYSDNPCGRALRKLIGANDAPLPAINDAGFLGTSLVNDYPTTSASDVGLFFERLYSATVFTPDVNSMLLDPLLEQEINNRLPAALPDDTQIAHKTADLEGYSHDGGIIYTPGGDYILVVLTGPWANGYTEAPSAHVAISSLVYDWFNPTVTTSSY